MVVHAYRLSRVSVEEMRAAVQDMMTYITQYTPACIVIYGSRGEQDVVARSVRHDDRYQNAMVRHTLDPSYHTPTVLVRDRVWMNHYRVHGVGRDMLSCYRLLDIDNERVCCVFLAQREWAGVPQRTIDELAGDTGWYLASPQNRKIVTRRSRFDVDKWHRDTTEAVKTARFGLMLNACTSPHKLV